MTGQTKIGSFIESVTNLIADVAIGIGSQMIIFPFLGYNVPMSDQFFIVAWFTIVNWLRMWVIRRGFNAGTIRRWFSQ